MPAAHGQRTLLRKAGGPAAEREPPQDHGNLIRLYDEMRLL